MSHASVFRIASRVAWLVLVAAIAVGCPRARRRPAGAPSVAEQEASTFSPPKVCANCHVGISVQYFRSMHSQSLSNPVFRAHYYREYMPLFHESPREYAQEPGCLRCHGPVAYLEFFQEARERIMVSDSTDCKGCHNETRVEETLAAPGVICDICHRIEGYDGPEPGNGNYIARPGRLKFGPFPYEADHHRQYAELQTQSELCGICHNTRNRYGVEVRSTYTEWKESRFADEGRQCQDCHMNAQILGDGTVVYESGKAAFMTVGDAPHRDKLYTHRFYGAHSRSQIDGALSLEIVAPERVQGGTQVPVRVVVHNEKTGHRMPTGSVELRTVWLELTARAQGEYGDDAEFEFQLINEADGYAVAGGEPDDARVLGDEIPAGARVYRAVFHDPEGRRTVMSYDAKERVFDNRLRAGEVREEQYELILDGDVRGWINIEATLHYLRFPELFAEKIRVRPVESVPFATASFELMVGGE